jgi:hypothetical protein
MGAGTAPDRSRPLPNPHGLSPAARLAFASSWPRRSTAEGMVYRPSRRSTQQCRELAEVATMPEVREQLGLFAEELEEDAAALDRMEQEAAPDSDSA